MSPRRGTQNRTAPQGGSENPINTAAIEQMITQRVADALAAYEVNRNNTNGNSGGASGSNNNSGNGSRPCSYKDFMNCKPRSFSGDEGVVGLIHWIEKMESVFHVSFCPKDSKVKFATCTFVDRALSWWNDHAKTLGIEAAYALSWNELKQMLVEEYCPRNEMQKLEQELWNLTMKGSDITTYTNRFNDLSTMCQGLVTPEYKKIERYIWDLAPSIQGMVTTSRPTTYDSAKQLAFRLTDQTVRHEAEFKKAEDTETFEEKRKFDHEFGGSTRQSSRKKQNTGEAYASTTPASRQYTGNLPKCNTCNYHHQGACRDLNCNLCNRKGHTARSCRSQPSSTMNQGPSSRGNGGCYKCGTVGHFRKDRPKLSKQGENPRGRAFVIGRQEAMEDLNMVTGN